MYFNATEYYAVPNKNAVSAIQISYKVLTLYITLLILYITLHI